MTALKYFTLILWMVSILTSKLEAKDPGVKPLVKGSSISDNGDSIKDNSDRNNGQLNHGTDGSKIDFGTLTSIMKFVLNATNRDVNIWLPRPKEVNEKCYDEITYFIKALLGQLGTNTSHHDKTPPDWAFQMFDAIGKPTSGLLEGSLQFVGSYQECLNVRAKMPSGTRIGSNVIDKETEFSTQYCRATILLNRQLMERSSYYKNMNNFWKSGKAPELIANWGVCVPKSCQSQDLKAILTKDRTIQLKTEEDLKHMRTMAKDRQYWRDLTQELMLDTRPFGRDVKGIYVNVVLCLFGSVVLIATVIETFWHYTKDKNNRVQLTPTKYDLKTGCPLNGCPSSKIGAAHGGIINRSIDISCAEDGLSTNQTCVEEDSKELNETDITRHKDSTNNHEHRGKLDGNGPKDFHVNVNDLADVNVDKVKNQSKLGIDTEDHKNTEEATIGGPQKTIESKREGTGSQFIRAFSMRLNLLRLLKTSGKSRPGVIRCVDGVRVFSMMWIVLGHTYTFGAIIDGYNILFINTLEVARTTARFPFFLVSSASLAVDSFFLISGMLITLLTLRDMKKRKRITWSYWVMFMLHRIWRLTPGYMVVLMFGITIYRHAIIGPMKSQPLAEFDDCASKWWSHLLYINNFYQPRQKCMTWTWYLAVDTQLYAVSPIILYVLRRWYRIGMSFIVFLIIAGMISAFLCQYYIWGQFLLMDQVFTDYWQYVYIVPWTRIGAFCVGMFIGALLVNRDRMPSISKTMSICAWIVATAVALIIIFIPYNQWQDGSSLWPRNVQALYEALSRPVWAMCVAWVIYSCYTQRGGIANNILCWPGFQPLSRIIYSVYLVHPIVITFFVYSRNTPLYLNPADIAFRYIGNMVLSFLFGGLICIMFESPILSLEKILTAGFGKVLTKDSRIAK